MNVYMHGVPFAVHQSFKHAWCSRARSESDSKPNRPVIDTRLLHVNVMWIRHLTPWTYQRIQYDTNQFTGAHPFIYKMYMKKQHHFGEPFLTCVGLCLPFVSLFGTAPILYKLPKKWSVTLSGRYIRIVARSEDNQYGTYRCFGFKVVTASTI